MVSLVGISLPLVTLNECRRSVDLNARVSYLYLNRRRLLKCLFDIFDLLLVKCRPDLLQFVNILQVKRVLIGNQSTLHCFFFLIRGDMDPVDDNDWGSSSGARGNFVASG